MEPKDFDELIVTAYSSTHRGGKRRQRSNKRSNKRRTRKNKSNKSRTRRHH
jgi:hypothetical protein